MGGRRPMGGAVAVTQGEKGGDTLSFNAKVDLVNF